MTDLKNMSVDKILQLVAPIAITHPHLRGVYDACSELARRLREREAVHLQAEESLGNAVNAGIILEEKLEQVESALLACQAREAELGEALDNLVASIIPQHKTFKHGNESSYFLAEQAQKLLSHSTGSKIMAVVEAAKEYAIAIERNDECDASVALCEAVRKLNEGDGG